MKAKQTTGKQSSVKAGEAIGGGKVIGSGNAGGVDNTIDFRKDTPPTDWLAKCVEERYGHLPPVDVKTEYDFVEEFVSKLAELRCKSDCANINGNGCASITAGASGLITNTQLTNGRLGATCICSLLAEMTREEAPLVPKGEFVAVVEAAGYNQKDALAHYRNYAWVKLHDEHKEETIRLLTESENAHNWWLELDSDEASAQSSAAEAELRTLYQKIDHELEAIMSA